MKIIFSIGLIVIFNISAFSQKYTVSGFAQDANSGEKLPYASIYHANTGKNITANNFGYFSISASQNSISLVVSFVGYKPSNLNLHLSSDTTISVLLGSNNELEEVVVIGEQQATSIRGTQFNISAISMKDIDKIPVVFGEPDVLKSIQLMPGIKGGQEGTSGLYVRGGSPDQNLILLDGVPVYNVNHLFGFFSVFNSDALKSVTAIKGGFPARYGGRLSSILDIQMKEGNNQEYKGEVSLGLISSRLTMEGPILKNRTSFIVSARRTYFDYLLALMNMSAKMPGEELKSGYFFYDLNAKVNHKVSKKSHIFLSLYSGKDKAFFDDKFSNYSSSTHNNFNLNWKNTTMALRYNYIITKSLFANTTLIYSKYRFRVGNSNETATLDPLQHIITEREYNGFSSSSGIKDLGVKLDFDYYAWSSHSIKFGINYTRHIFTPEVSTKVHLSGNNENVLTDTTFGNINIPADEFAAYVEDEWEISSKIAINLGLRFASFYVQHTNYPVIEPRLSIRYLINEKISLKVAYSRMDQFIQLITNSSVGLPTDLWLPVTDKIKPLNSDQFAFGGQYNLNAYKFEVECFYKFMNNLNEYKEGIEYAENTGSWEDKIEKGKGDAYGIEFQFSKVRGKATGWIGYTLSWSNRQFDNINEGKEFPYKYDKRHDISIVLTYKLSDRIDFGATWVFNTGNPITIATQKYAYVDDLEGDMIYYYSKRNEYRMPSYHRLDIGANFYKTKKRGIRVWSLSIYNAYNHTNPYIVFINNNNGESEMKQYSLFPIMPAFSYTFKF